MAKDCGMIWVISAMVAASEWEEPGRLTLVDRGGTEEGIDGLMVRSGAALDRFPDEWMCRRCSIEARLEVPGVEESSGERS